MERIELLFLFLCLLTLSQLSLILLPSNHLQDATLLTQTLTMVDMACKVEKVCKLFTLLHMTLNPKVIYLSSRKSF